MPSAAPQAAAPAPNPWRLALCIDALHPRARRSEHPRCLAQALEAAGARAGVVAVAGGLRWPAPVGSAGGGADLERLEPNGYLAYDPMSPAAWWAARRASERGLPLVLVEPGWTGPRRLHERFLDGLGARLWGRAVRSAAGRVVALDPWTAARALERGFAPERLARVPSGVDVERFRPGRSSSLVGRHRLSGRLLVYAGPLEAGRGVELLVEAFARGIGRRQDWNLVLAGGGGQARRLRAAADRLGVGASVHLIGWPEADELAGLLAAATLFAAPDLGDEASGQQVLRAMATGLPTVVADRPRLAAAVADGVSGLVVPAGDLAAWTAALARLAGDPALRAALGSGARQWVLERCTWPRVAAAMLEQFEALAPRAARSAG